MSAMRAHDGYAGPLGTIKKKKMSDFKFEGDWETKIKLSEFSKFSNPKFFKHSSIPNPDGTEFFGSPTKLFEYMAMGKAIVASDLNQIGEILAHESTALLIEANQPKLLANSINKLVLDEALQKKLGENARKEALQNYSWDRHVERLLEFIK